MNGKKDFAWLKERFTVLMGRPPADHELDRLMKVKEKLEIDYDDPVILQLLALEYYCQLYEQVPDKIRTVIQQAEAHAVKHFEQKASEIAQQQMALLTKASNAGLLETQKSLATMRENTRTAVYDAVKVFLNDEFQRTAHGAFMEANVYTERASSQLRHFVHLHKVFIFATSLLAGIASAIAVLVYQAWKS